MRESKPILTPQGKVIELVETGVFERAIADNPNITMTVDHNPNRVLASTKSGNLELREDYIGLHAVAEFSDSEIAAAARKGLLKGWSFGMKNVACSIEERTDNLPLRRIKGMQLDHVTLVLHKSPAYCATSVELRAGGEEEVTEIRTIQGDCEISADRPQAAVDFTAYENRIKNLKGV